VDAQKPYATNPANVNQGRGNAATTTAKPKDEKVDCSKCPCDNALLKEKQAAAEKAAVEEAKVKEEVAEKENLDNAINKYLKSYNYDALDSSNDRKLKRKKRQLERKIRRAQMRIERQKGGL
jgi:hypothetical protein